MPAVMLYSWMRGMSGCCSTSSKQLYRLFILQLGSTSPFPVQWTKKQEEGWGSHSGARKTASSCGCSQAAAPTGRFGCRCQEQAACWQWCAGVWPTVWPGERQWSVHAWAVQQTDKRTHKSIPVQTHEPNCWCNTWGMMPGTPVGSVCCSRLGFAF